VIRYTELKSTNRQNLMEVLPLPKPFTVLIEPSSLCNFKCVQCFQSLPGESYFTRNRMHMPLERFRRVLGQLQAWEGPKLKVLKLNLYGEPLIAPHFGEMLRLAREANVADRIETTTNASLLSREIAQAMVRWQLDYVRVSIYAATQERHREVSGSPISVGRIHENLRVLQELKRESGSERPFVSCKMLDAYGEENERFKRAYEDVADELYLDEPHSWIGVEGADFIGTHYGERGDGVRDNLRHNSTPRVACPMPFTTMAVRSNGDVSPCCLDFVGGTNLGNVDDDSLEGLWHSDRWHEFLKMQLQNRRHENSSCARCDVPSSNHYTRDNIDGFPVEKLRGR
jgi:radical SAM protein with 4Fe4S-binding SPASM domain